MFLTTNNCLMDTKSSKILLLQYTHLFNLTRCAYNSQVWSFQKAIGTLGQGKRRIAPHLLHSKKPYRPTTMFSSKPHKWQQ